MTDVVVSVLILFGAGLVLVAAIGIGRLPDILCRAHAVAKASTLGIFSIMIGMWAALGAGSVGLKIALAIAFQVATIPLSSHLLSLLAFRKNIPRWRERPMDDHRGPPAAPP
jgi:multicomponent Na+:H+ antiporter subunit G